MVFPLIRFLERYGRWAVAHPAIPLVAVLLLCALCFIGARRIGLDASFEALLPEDTPSVRAREEVRERMGAADLYVIAIRGPDPEANYRFAEAVREGVDGWEETLWVMKELDLEVFRNRALLYLDLEELTELVDLVELRISRSMCERRGDCRETDLRTPAEVIRDERRLDVIRGAQEEQIAETAGDRSALGERYPELRDALMNDDGTVAVVMGRLSRGTSDIAFAREVMLRGETLVADLDPTSYHPEMIARVAGAYGSLNEYDTVLTDATKASVISLCLVLLLIVVLVRRLRAVVIIGGSLLVGLTWAMGVTSVTLPTFNTVTAVIFGILLGMGIDFPIHLTVAVRSARGPETELADAVAEAIRRTVPAMLTSAFTTAAALLTLVSAQNRGFREFGIIGAFGVTLCLAATVTVAPPMMGLLDRIRPDTKPLWLPSDAWLARRGPAVALALVVLLGGLLAWRAPRLPFEYDLSNLGAPRTRTGIAYGGALRTGAGTTPVVLLGDDEEQLRRAHRVFTKQQADGDARIGSVLTIETFVPPQQEEKLEELERLADTLNPRILKRVKGEDREALGELARLAEVSEPITFEALPHWAKRNLVERDGSVGHLGFIYTTGRREDARGHRRLQQEMSGLDVGGTRPLRAASARFVIADVVFTMIEDGKRMALLAVIAIVLLLALDLRSPAGVVLSVLALGFGVLWAFGAARWLGWKLGVFNMLVIPVALGLGIDGAIHVYHRYRRDPAAFARSPLGSTGFAVLASSLTTIAGFTGLLFVAHRGLLSIGQLAVVTIAATAVAVLGVLPGGLLLLARRKAKTMSQGADAL